ncbi:MAG: PAS domain S-box protein [Desulfobulbaceae bacterium]|nr:PAS domain S-box protein [Desulfobulbaceae bacterium]
MRSYRVTIALITLIVIQCVFFAAVIVGERHQRWQEARVTAETMASISASSTKDFFNKYLSIFDTLKSVEFITRQEAEPSSGILFRLNHKYPEIVNFAAVKQNGDFFASGNPMPEGKVPNVKHLDFVQRIFSGEKHVIMQPHQGPISKEMVTGIAVPLENMDGKINGIIGVSIEFQALINRWENLLSDKKIMMAVHDINGHIHYMSPNLNLQNKAYLKGNPPEKIQKIKIAKKTVALYTISHPESGWNFSVFVPAYNDFIHLLVSRMELIFLFALMVITVTTLGVWFYQEKMWTTKLSKEQKKLQQSESKFRQLAENISAAFWISSPDKNSIIYVSPGYEKIWGKDCQTLYDNPWMWVEAIHADDRLKIEDAEKKKLLKGTYDELYRIVRDDNTIRWVHDRAFPLSDETGEIHRIVGIAVDVTDRIKAEELLRRNKEELKAVLDNSVDAICVFQQGVHKFVNLAYLKMFCYQDANELVGKPISELIAPAKRSEVRQFVSARAEGKLPSAKYQTKGLRRDGVEFDMEVNVTQYGQEDDKNTLVILRDVTDLKRKEEEKDNLEKQLQQAQKMEAIGTLAGGIAHDFNNILAAIIGYAEMAKDDCQPGSTISQDLNGVLEAGNRAKSLVCQILAFSRQDDTERMILQPASIIKETITMLRPSLPTTIEITQDINAVAGLVFVDPTQLNQILMNLCTNAFHAMEDTGGKLDILLKEVTLSNEDLVHQPDVTGGTFIQLSIGDSGTGIAPTVKDKIFDPYFTTKEISKGTGMGLSMVHGIVKNYGGFISLDSELGEGTVFHVFLPTVEKEALTENEINDEIPIGREKILLVDDEEILAKMGKTMLERLGYHVTVRSNSFEALETFQNQPDKFDIVITDQTMPGMTGSDLSRRMLQIRPDIPIILCTGYSTIISEEKAKSMGIKEFAFKPLAKKDIAKMIRKVLDNP